MITFGSALFVSLGSVSAFAGEEGVHVSAHFETMAASRYVVRGAPQLEEPSGVLLSAAGVNVHNIGPGAVKVLVENAVALSSFNAQGGAQLELNAHLGYAMQAGPLALDARYVAHFFPKRDQVDGAQELQFTAAFPNAIVTPSVVVLGNLVAKDVYMGAGVSRSFVGGPFTVTPSLMLGVLAEEHHLHTNDVTASLQAAYEIMHGFAATAMVSYSYRGSPELTAKARDVYWAAGGFKVEL